MEVRESVKRGVVRSVVERSVAPGGFLVCFFVISLQLGRFSRKGTKLPRHPDQFPGFSQ